MNRQEVADLLRYVASVDGRKITDVDVLSWHDLLGSLSSEEAHRATREFYDHSPSKRITPAAIRHDAKQARSKSAARKPSIEPPPVNPDDVKAYLAALRDPESAPVPQPPTKTLPEGVRPDPEPPRPTHASPLNFPCSWCRAAPGEPCKNVSGRPLRAALAHPARLDAAKETA